MDSSSGGTCARGVWARLIRYVWLLGILGCAHGVSGIDSTDERKREPASTGLAGAGPVEGVENDPWCLARTVLENKCQSCHGEPTANGAPFALVSFDDTQQLNNRGKPRFELIAAAVSDELMPPLYLKLEPPVVPLDEQERASLLAWCDAGGPEPVTPCD